MNNNQQNIPPGAPGGRPVQVTIDMKHTELWRCRCGHARFIPVNEVRRLPAVVSPTGQEQILVNSILLECQDCGETYDLTSLRKAQEEIRKRELVVAQNPTGGSNGNGNKV